MCHSTCVDIRGQRWSCPFSLSLCGSQGSHGRHFNPWAFTSPSDFFVGLTLQDPSPSVLTDRACNRPWGCSHPQAPILDQMDQLLPSQVERQDRNRCLSQPLLMAKGRRGAGTQTLQSPSETETYISLGQASKRFHRLPPISTVDWGHSRSQLECHPFFPGAFLWRIHLQRSH